MFQVVVLVADVDGVLETHVLMLSTICIDSNKKSNGHRIFKVVSCCHPHQGSSLRRSICCDALSYLKVRSLDLTTDSRRSDEVWI